MICLEVAFDEKLPAEQNFCSDLEQKYEQR